MALTCTFLGRERRKQALNSSFTSHIYKGMKKIFPSPSGNWPGYYWKGISQRVASNMQCFWRLLLNTHRAGKLHTSSFKQNISQKPVTSQRKVSLHLCCNICTYQIKPQFCEMHNIFLSWFTGTLGHLHFRKFEKQSCQWRIILIISYILVGRYLTIGICNLTMMFQRQVTLCMLSENSNLSLFHIHEKQGGTDLLGGFSTTAQ